MAVRRFVAKRSMKRFLGTWPINPLASRPPDRWSGWPDGKKFAFVLTHDVECQKGLDRCRQLAKMEMSFGFRSSFNFVPEGEYETPRSLRDFLATQGFEVGVHDLRHDGRLFSSRRNFRNLARKINESLAVWEAVGFRSGFMLHNLDWVGDLNIQYDSSTFDTDPFEPQPDGVNTIFPFWVDRGDGSGFVELPYTLPQDSTLFLVLQESTIDTWTRKLDWVAQHGGLALVIVHPDYLSLDGVKRPGEYRAQLYEQFLEYVAKRYAGQSWFALPREVAAYVRETRARYHDTNASSPSRIWPVNPATSRPDGPALASLSSSLPSSPANSADTRRWRLQGKRVGMVMFSDYPSDPRPRRAAEALANQGMRVDLICLASDDKESRREVSNGIDIVRIPIRRSRGSIFTYVLEYSAFLLTSAATLALRTLTRGYDLVYVHNMPDILVLSALVPKAFGAKVILDLHDPMPELMTTIYGLEPNSFPVRLLRRLERRSIAVADSVVTVNRACAKLFASRSCPLEKMNVVMNSPDEQIFRLRPPQIRASTAYGSPKPFTIMYHGSLVERNGLELAIDALSRVRESVPNVQLKIYGWQNAFLERVMRSVEKKGLQEAVQYFGPKSLEQLVEVMEECDLGIIPNLRSRFSELNTPTRIFEYLAAGKPVIAPQAAGILDYFDEGSLLFFELGNAEDLAQKIEYVFSHPAEVAQIVKRGQQIYHEHSWSKERLRLIDLVSAVLFQKDAALDSTGQAGRSAGKRQLSPVRNGVTSPRSYQLLENGNGGLIVPGGSELMQSSSRRSNFER